MIDHKSALSAASTPDEQSTAHRRTRVHAADLLLPTAIALWGVGLSRTHATRLGLYGLPPALPIIFYVGFGFLILSIASEIARARPSVSRLAAHAVSLIVMLYGTAPLVYPEGRYEWLYKTIGVVQYVNDHGQLNRYIDIYQNWPGFFAFAAWFDKVAGVASPLSYAKWAQLVFELASLPLLYLCYDALRLNTRHRWVAIFLYYASNWIGQDYFSPQALATVLSLGIMAIALRWLYSPKPTAIRSRRRRRKPLRAALDVLLALSTEVSRPRYSSAGTVSAVLVTYLVLTFTHELSPYLLALQLAAIAALRFIKPRWLPLALLAIALAYFLPRYEFVTSHFSVLSIGAFFSNAAPPAFSRGSPAFAELVIERSAEALSAGIWIASAVGAWLRRRTGYPVLTLALLAYSPILMLAVAAYGQEGILRVYLFSLPWTAALASLALLAPSTKPTADGATASRHRSARQWSTSRWQLTRLRLGAARVPLALATSLALFFPAFFGDDGFNVMTGSQVWIATAFWQTAQPGRVYLPIDDAPVSDTGKYNLFPVTSIFGAYSLLGYRHVRRDVAELIQKDARRYDTPGEPAYVMFTPNMALYNQEYGSVPQRSFSILRQSLAQSPSWVLIFNSGGVVIYRLVNPTDS